ncbi:MAG: c-type cytochrome [Bryobacteraceae bacterium]
MIWRGYSLLALLLASLASGQEKGAILFATHCAPCHGAKGDGGRGSNLAVPKLPRAADDTALSNIVTLGIPGTQMPGTRMTSAENRDLVDYVRALGLTVPAAVEGDPARGETLFNGKGGCRGCHSLGPDLSDIGVRRSISYLRKSLTDPEAEVPESFAVYRRIILMPDNFLMVHVVTAEGRAVTGFRLNEDTFTIQLRDFDGRIYSFDKSELKDLQKLWGKSPMPSYSGVFSDSELTDVVAYLASLRGER